MLHIHYKYFIRQIIINSQNTKYQVKIKDELVLIISEER
jgi:hypothetical protein